jgi:SulP family sulfate permease
MPMAAMAGTLFIVGADMIKWQHIQHYAQIRSELGIYLATFIGIAFFGLTAGVLIAIVLSITVFMRLISQLELKQETTPTGTLLKIRGALFYASAGQLADIFHQNTDRHLTLDLQYTTHLDQSAVDFFIRESRNMARHGGRLTLLINEKQRQYLHKLGVNGDIELIKDCESIPLSNRSTL